MNFSATSAGRRRFAAPPMAEINIIPLVDVTLVILIIFMVTTSFEKKKPTPPPVEPPLVLPVELPYAAAATNTPNPEPDLVIGVDRNGQKYIGATPVSTETFHQKLKETAAANAKRRVRLDADKEARYADVVEVVELCDFEGLQNVGLHTANH